MGLNFLKCQSTMAKVNILFLCIQEIIFSPETLFSERDKCCLSVVLTPTNKKVKVWIFCILQLIFRINIRCRVGSIAWDSLTFIEIVYITVETLQWKCSISPPFQSECSWFLLNTKSKILYLYVVTHYTQKTLIQKLSRAMLFTLEQIRPILGIKDDQNKNLRFKPDWISWQSSEYLFKISQIRFFFSIPARWWHLNFSNLQLLLVLYVISILSYLFKYKTNLS